MPTLMACGLICAVLSVLTGVRLSGVKARSISRHLAKPALEARPALLFLLSINREGKNRGARRNLGLRESIRRREEYQAQTELHKTLRWPSWRACRSIEPDSSTRLEPSRASSERWSK